MSEPQSFEFDVFVSYRWVEPDQSWVRNALTPALRAAGLEVCLDVDDFVPGRDVIAEMSRAGQASRKAVCVLTPRYFDGNRLSHFESLAARRRDPGGVDSVLIPLVLEAANLPDWIRGLIPVDWTDPKSRAREWSKLLKVLNAPGQSDPPADLPKFSDTSHSASGNALRKEFVEFLDDTEVTLSNQSGARLRLKDIFVWPDLQPSTGDKLVSEILRPSQYLAKTKGRYLVIGAEQSGKTALGKQLFSNLHVLGGRPVYLDVRATKHVDVADQVRKALKEAYEDPEAEPTAILIDGLERSPLNEESKVALLQRAMELTEHLIVFSGDDIRYSYSETSIGNALDAYRIRPFGHQKREEFIEKWVSHGRVETIPDSVKLKEIDALKVHIDSLVHKNIVPTKPIFIAILLQSLEAGSSRNLEITSYAHCYAHLIYETFSSAKIDKRLYDAYLNYLQELAFEIFSSAADMLDESRLDGFHKRYSHEYVASKDLRLFANDLIEAGVLRRVEDSIRFSYSYIYYYFVAKYLADRISESVELKEKVSSMIDDLHVWSNAQVIVFLTHHSKDRELLLQLERRMLGTFEKLDEATLSIPETQFLGEFVREIPEVVLEQRRTKDHRERRNKAQEQRERYEEDLDQRVAKLDGNHFLSELYRATKGIEIVGQIVRNHHGSMRKEEVAPLLWTIRQRK